MSLFVDIKPLILVGCSGSGRSALMFNLHRNMPQKFERLISHTTRKPRQGEKEGKHFYFVNQQWINQNKNKFVTLTFSGNNNFYGLTRDQISRVIDQNKIPVFKMTLDAYAKNVGLNGNILIDNPRSQQQITNKQQPKQQNSQPRKLYLMKDRKIQCNALYIRIPSFTQLQRRLKFTPFTQYQRIQKLTKARQQHNQAFKYFEPKDIIGKQNQTDLVDIQFQDTVMRLQSRLFELY